MPYIYIKVTLILNTGTICWTNSFTALRQRRYDWLYYSFKKNLINQTMNCSWHWYWIRGQLVLDFYNIWYHTKQNSDIDIDSILLNVETICWTHTTLRQQRYRLSLKNKYFRMNHAQYTILLSNMWKICWTNTTFDAGQYKIVSLILNGGQFVLE